MEEKHLRDIEENKSRDIGDTSFLYALGLPEWLRATASLAAVHVRERERERCAVIVRALT